MSLQHIAPARHGAGDADAVTGEGGHFGVALVLQFANGGGSRGVPLSAVTLLVLASQYKPKQSPPMPVEPGSTTFNMAAVAMAASAALPPPGA